ncbi:MAG: flagellar hook-basal body complex protein [Planctomycetota bacterium]|nr:flagellar hook-basal body complex protein [Planctomycetota bacterium]
MASTTSLLTGLSGLNANSRRLEVIGNNISNTNTTAFKSNRLLFAPALSRNLSLGTAPTGASGGTNPGQVGLGVEIAGTQRNFNNGAVSTTGVNTDLALEGDGFFIVERGQERFFTRAGSFQLNSVNELVTISGERVQGYMIDDQFNIVEGQLTDLIIPEGSLTLAEATENVNFAGNLNADINGLPTQGALISFDQVFETTAGAPMVGTDLLSPTLQDPSAAPGTALFPAPGQDYVLTISGAMKGNKNVPDASLTIDATTTVNDLLEFLNDTFGIVDGLVNPDGSTTGAQIDGAGNLTIVGNAGEINNITFDESNISIVDGAGAAVTNPLTLTQDQSTGLADGESVRTTFIVYDSLGTPLEVDLTLVFDSADSTGTTWRYFVDSQDNLDLTDPDFNVATGTISFDNFGRITTSGGVQITVERDNTGALDPLTFTLNFNSDTDQVTALANPDPDGGSVIGATFQDGTFLGTLSTFSVGEDGTITGAFTNGLTRTIGQIALAKFTNPEGLVDAGNNLFRVGPNSGTPIVSDPGEFGTGRVVGGALELSNVDLGEEFTNLILTTTGYTASSRVISTTDQLLQQLVALGR